MYPWNCTLCKFSEIVLPGDVLEEDRTEETLENKAEGTEEEGTQGDSGETEEDQGQTTVDGAPESSPLLSEESKASGSQEEGDTSQTNSSHKGTVTVIIIKIG